MPALNNKATTDRYDDTVLHAPNSASFTLQVNNAAVYYQLAVKRHGVASALGAESWEPPEGVFLSPGFWNFGAADFGGAAAANGIRVQSAVPGAPAQVTISA